MSNSLKKCIQYKCSLIFLISIFLIQSCCTKEISVSESFRDFPLIPIPSEISKNESKQTYFELNNGLTIYINELNNETHRVAEYLSSKLRSATGFNVELKEGEQDTSKGNIFLQLLNVDDLGEEGYELNIKEDYIDIKAFKPAGLFYAVQTLRQLFPHEIENNQVQNCEWKVPTVSIKDFPRYKWRGSMLDVARHFFSVEDVKKYIDYLAFYKMNKLHLHLSDDQGWRIEIKSWPNLTKIGGSTEVDSGKGGYYTQEEYKDIVKYAKDNFISVIPEIDMPGHTNAALASYAELNCDGKARELYTGIEVGFSSLCINKELTYKFIDDVIGEISVLTDGQYFHIGGDEAHSTDHKDYIKFIERVEEIVESHGKIMIGWDEIANTEIKNNSLVQYWNSSENALTADKKGLKIIMSPSNRIYLDMKYDEHTELGLNWAGYVSVQRAYDWDPSEEIEGVCDTSIAGIEAPLWSETIKNMDDVEYLTFPKLAGVAEIGWSQKENRDWENYRLRLIKHTKRLKALGINYFKAPELN